MNTPLEHAISSQIGTVESVAPDRIVVLLTLDAPQGTALNTGVPTGFPRINGYVLIPSTGGAVVGQVHWLGIERSNFPKRTGLKDFGLIDLPFPLRKMSVALVGTLLRADGDAQAYKLERGVVTFPSVGDAVQIPTSNQLRAIVEATGDDQRVRIGVAPMAGSAPVSVDPNKLFGRHLAVLGNTGSGKSCSVAGLIRWSLEAARSQRSSATPLDSPLNARFVILDPNGEYSAAFADLGPVRLFRAPPLSEGTSAQSLQMPAWMWNSHEWSAFAQAQPGMQRPLLMQALRELKRGRTADESVEARARRNLALYSARIAATLSGGGYMEFPGRNDFATLLRHLAEDATAYSEQLAAPLSDTWGEIAQAAQELHDYHHRRNPNTGKEWVESFSETSVRGIYDRIAEVLGPGVHQAGESGPTEDAPIQFALDQLAPLIEQLAGETQTNAANLVQFLTLRIRNMLGDARLGSIVAPATPISLEEWLENIVGGNGGVNGPVSVIDLSLVAPDVLHIVVAVIGRVIFEAAQRYRRSNSAELPTVLVLEEAHTFVRRGESPDDMLLNQAQMCRVTFERIAREGRKFGLGLVLASQRPAELSPTVLAQCNTFLLHRIVNDQDQELVRKLVPDNLGGLLSELPSLPSRRAVLLGWAAPVPVLVEMRKLPDEHCPQSTDPDFWRVWTGEVARPVDWSAIATEWDGRNEGPRSPSPTQDDEIGF